MTKIFTTSASGCLKQTMAYITSAIVPHDVARKRALEVYGHALKK